MKQLRFKKILIVFLAICFLAVIGYKVAGLRGGEGNEISVFVPCGLQGPFLEISDAFEEKYPQIKVSPYIENITVLVHRIKEGEKPDVFLSLGDLEVKQLTEAGRLVEESVTPFAANSLAVVVPGGNPGKIERIEDLAKEESGKICLPNPEYNSSGYYAKQALQNAGLWEAIENQDRVIAVRMPSDVKLQVRLGKVGAGIIYEPCLKELPIGGKKRKKKGPEFRGAIPPDLYKTFYCTAAITRDSNNPGWGRKFIKFMLSDEAQEIMKKWDFGPLVLGGAQKPLFIHSGGGLRPVMDDLAELFEQKYGVRTDISYKGSPCLLADINFSRRGDLYIPGEEFYMLQAQERGFVKKYEIVAYFVAVIGVQKGNPKNIHSLEDLAKRGIEVGLGDPEACAVGRVAEEILKKAGLSKAVHKNVVMRSLTVNELVNHLKLRGVDAAIVWDAMAALVPKDVDIVPIPAHYPRVTKIPLGILNFSKNPEAAEEFLALALSEEGRALFRKHHYTTELREDN